MNKSKIIIFTDLDGTLIDHDTYSYNSAKPALQKISENDIPLILVSSKTAAEMIKIRQDLKKDGFKIDHPFIVENGSAIYIPKDYFDFDVKQYIKCHSHTFCHSDAKPKNLENRDPSLFVQVIDSEAQTRRDDKQKSLEDVLIIGKNQYQVVKISQVNYGQLTKILKEIEKQIDGKIIGFNDLSPRELSAECGLSIKQAKLAKTREFDEPFRIVPDKPKLYNQVEKLIIKQGLNYTKGGRYAHIMGKQDKGLAVQMLIKLYQSNLRGEISRHLVGWIGKHIQSIGIGDSRNDLEMLEKCDQGYLVANPKKPIDTFIKNSKIKKVKEIGPKGFNKVVLKIISKFKT